MIPHRIPLLILSSCFPKSNKPVFIKMKTRLPRLVAATTALFLAAGLSVRAEDAPVAGEPATAEAKAPAEVWLGALTKTLPRLVGEHLGLAPGHGLSVEMVVPDGPSAKAGLQKDDVLVKLADQQLVLPEQLAILVQSHQPGDTRKLEILRDGKPLTLDVTLTPRPPEYARRERPAGAERRADNGVGGLNPAPVQVLPFEGDVDIAQMEKRLEQMRERLQQQAGRMADQLAQGQAPGQVNMQVFRLDQGRVQIGDDKGIIEIEKKDGVMTLTAKDKQGNVMFEGPYSTDEEKARVPEEIRKRAGRFKFEDGGMRLQKMFEAPCEPAKPEIEGDVKPGERVD